MGKLKSLAGETALYGLGSMVPRMMNFLLVMLHTDVFAAEEYGVITKMYAYVGVINILYMFGMETAYFRFATKPGADEKRIFNLAQTAVVILSATLSLSFVIFTNPIADGLALEGKVEYIYWFVAIMFIDAVVAIPFAQLRLYKKAKRFAFGKLANIILLIALNVYFLKINFNPALGVDFVFLSNLIANAFYIIFFAPVLLKWRLAFDSSLIKSMTVYAYPIMLTGLAGMVNEMFSRITLEWWLPPNFYPGKSEDYALGVFGACYKLAIFMNLAIQAFRFAAEPFFFSNAIDKNAPKLFARINHYFIIVCCFIMLGVSLNIDLLKHFLRSDEYWEGLQVVPILLLAYLFLGIYYNLTVWFKLTDKTYFGTIISVGGAIITIGLNYLLIPQLGYVGSSIAALLCYVSMSVACYAFGQKYYPIPYKITPALVYILITCGLVWSVPHLTFSATWQSLLINNIIILIFAGAVYQLEKHELKKVE